MHDYSTLCNNVEVVLAGAWMGGFPPVFAA